MNGKFITFDGVLEDFQNSIPFFNNGEGGAMRKMVIGLRFRLGFGSGPNPLRKDRQAIENALPMVRAKIQQAIADVDHAWFFNKTEARQKRDILVTLYNHMVYALDLVIKSGV